jgi:hypothetical protein
VARANAALADFGSPYSLSVPIVNDENLQIGLPPNRIDLILHMEGARFSTAWKNRVRSRYGRVEANWIGLDSLLRIKSRIDSPRHKEDARVLREVRRLRSERHRRKPRSGR